MPTEFAQHKDHRTQKYFDAVIDFLKENPKSSCKTIGDGIGESKEKANRILTRLLEDGEVIQEFETAYTYGGTGRKAFQRAIYTLKR